MGDSDVLESVPVSTFAADEVISVHPEASIRDVALSMAAEDVGAIALMEGAHVVGIVSERDVVGAVAAGLPLDDTPALEIATTELRWCDAGAPVSDVASEMLQHYVRHVLLEDGAHLAGIISARDLLGVYATADLDLR